MYRPSLPIVIVTAIAVLFGGALAAKAQMPEDSQIFAPSGVNAIQTQDQAAKQAIDRNTAATKEGVTNDQARYADYMANLKLGSRLFQTTLRTALNTLAFDMANWVASGASGQEAAFERRSLGRVFSDSLDAAAGEFLSTLGTEKFAGFNMCNPQLLDLHIKIGLGLTQYQRPTPQCTFSELRNNWEREIQSLDFLANFQSYFEISANDVGSALSIQSAFLQAINKDAAEAVKEVELSEGWRADIGLLIDKDDRKVPPGALRASFEQQAIRNPSAELGKFTGDAMIDALNIFINQLAIQLINTLLRGGLFGRDSERDSAFVYDFQADSRAGEGIAAAKDRLRAIIQPRFDVRGDYDILAELTTCPDPTNAGPTNCVILDKFRQAVQERKTVGAAMAEGFLSANGTFGFDAENREPLLVNENYPYRSMIILRKFRIIPVGWEVAASYINENINKKDASGNPVLEKSVYTLKDMVECFETGPLDRHTGTYEPWCEGLVDPDWVLKAPLNYCARQGYGPTVFSTDEDATNIIRRDNYCADEQACIKENNDGSCEVYGYCTEERRTWNFGGNSCEPVYNTCQTFRAQTGGQTVSYLENTLEWCSENGIGCREYDLTGTYEPANGIVPARVTWDDTGARNFNKNIETCDERSEGCTELIRASAGLGTNLIPNGSFEAVQGSVLQDWKLSNGQFVPSTQRTTEGMEGGNALTVSPGGSIGQTVGNLQLRDQQPYIISLYVKGGSGQITVNVGSSTHSFSANTNGQWQRVHQTFTPTGNQALTVTITSGSPADVALDAVQLEEVTTATSPSPYSDYRANAVYQKMLPDYLVKHANDSTAAGDDFEGVCYDDNGDLLVNAPAICNNFTRMCQDTEVGCELYTRVRDGFEVPGKVKYAADEATSGYCPSECGGYDKYVQRATDFELRTERNLIPATGQTCSAAAVGCEEFTNLDEVAQGGEGIEYYSQLRQCTANSSEQKGFYTWEGTEDTGFQLRVFALKDTDEAVNRPDVTQGVIDIDTATGVGIHKTAVTGGTVLCNEEIFNASIQNNPDKYNPDCRQVYARDGTVTYALFSKVIFYSTDCHPYRLSAKYTGRQCTLSGGAMQGGACVYMAIPRQGVQCAAAEVSCRAYTGNTGGNVRVVLADDFEDGETGGWGVYDDGSTILDSLQTANQSLKANGSSLWVATGRDTGNREAVKEFTTAIQGNKSYVVEFIARSAASNDTVTVNFYSKELNQNMQVGSVTLDQAWKSYAVRLDSFATHEPQPDESLHFFSNGADDFYIDSVIVREVTDAYYLIKDSWQTPQSCVEAGGSPFETAAFWEVPPKDSGIERDGVHLGCYEYRNRANQSVYIKKFDSLCAESAVGCELMVDTANYTPPGQGAGWPEYGVQAADVPADSYKYVVYNPAKSCDASAKGCMLTGQKQVSSGTYQSAYIKNNPDTYSRTLCSATDVGCTAWTGTDGKAAYFKDPGANTCQYRDGYYGENWYRERAKRCDVNRNGRIDTGERPTFSTYSAPNYWEQSCTSDAQCATDVSCIEDTWDQLCPLDNSGAPKTAGIGGVGNRVEQPATETDYLNNPIRWAGVCPAAQSSCTEVIDPLSASSVNMLTTGTNQTVELTPNTLYRGSGNVSIDNILPAPVTNNTGIFYLDEDDNKFEPGFPSAAIDAFRSDTDKSWLIWYAGGATEDSIHLDVRGTNPFFGKAIVNYQLADALDASSCNGRVDAKEGCILFNVREGDGKNDNGTLRYASLPYAADAGGGAQAVPTLCSGSNSSCNANRVLKVQADRVCSEWLACRSSAVVRNEENGKDEQVCYDIGTCDGLNGANQCSSWVSKANVSGTVTNQNITLPVGNSSRIYVNSTGYTKVGITGEQRAAQGYLPFGEMEQRGGLAVVPNGGFELTSGFNVPFSWSVKKYQEDYAGTAGLSVDVPENIVSTVDSVQEAQQFDIQYPIEGSHFLALGTDYLLDSQVPLEVAPNTDYTLSFYVNTLSLNRGKMDLQVRNANQSGYPLIASESQSAGLGWRKRFVRFNSGSANRAIIVITPRSEEGQVPLGTIFVDDVKIRPTLYMQDDGSDEWHTDQSCRLYPQADALTCEYVDTEGAWQRGWYGYCLEYDRAPVGNPNACLLWWPVDRVKGDSINEQVPSYAGRSPLYYCTETEQQRFIAIPDELKNIRMPAELGCKSKSDNGYFDELDYDILVNGVVQRHASSNLKAMPGSDPRIPGYGKVGGSDSSVELRLEAAPVFTVDGINYYDFTKVALLRTVSTDCKNRTENHWDSADPFMTKTVAELAVSTCTRLVQVVDAIGQNKAWSTRVQQGTPHDIEKCYDALLKVDANRCKYHFDLAPFGSLTYPSPAEEPVLWTSKSGLMNVPLLAEDVDRDLSYPYQVRFRYTHPYSIPAADITRIIPPNPQGQGGNGSGIMSVFAKSYGSWSWQWETGNAGTCRSGGTCSNNATAACQIGNNVNGNDPNCTIAASSNICVFPSICVGGFNNGGVCTGNSGACAPSPASCNAGRCGAETGIPGNPCTTEEFDSTGAPNERYYRNAGVCWNNNPVGSCVEQAGEDDGTCSYTGTECSNDNQCGESKGYCVSNCTAGLIGNACTSNAQCSASGRSYRKDAPSNQVNWDLPNRLCDDLDGNPATPGPQGNHNPGSTYYCAEVPSIDNVKVNGTESVTAVRLTKAAPQARLEFNANADDDQLPLVELRVDWGDGDQTSVTGMRMRDRVNAEYPFTFYHVYTYNDLLAKNSGATGSRIWCNAHGEGLPSDMGAMPSGVTGNYCITRPTMWVRDNWGWYSNGTQRDTPPGVGTVGNYTVVTEK